jgi:hypothetical protein
MRTCLFFLIVYYMLQMCNDAERNHRLTFTTHSFHLGNRKRCNSFYSR